MSASIRFLGFAVLAWAGVRAASLALVPGSISPVPAAKTAAIRPVAPTRFDPPPPPDPVPQQTAYPGMAPGFGAYFPAAYQPAFPPPYAYPRGDRTIVIPASWPAPGPPRFSRDAGWAGIMPTPRQS